MTNKNKVRVAVLYGGKSGEHEVSLLSATNVIQNLDRSLFDVVPIGIDKTGCWYLGDDVFKKGLKSPELLSLNRAADRMLFNPESLKNNKNLSVQKENNSIQNNSNFDVVFPAIHGPLCEDGTVQGLLELAEVPYVGCNVLSSAVNMDKDIAKRLAQYAGINVAPFLVIKKSQFDLDQDYFINAINKDFDYPVFVKPSNTGSSVGITKVVNSKDLLKSIQYAFNFDIKVIIEKSIDAVEIELAVLEPLNPVEDPIVSFPGQVKPTANHDFYSYDSKYKDSNGADLKIPADISSDLQSEARNLAKDIFTALECEGMARVDLFLDKNTNEFYFNEINTLPGFTEISMYPKLMAHSNIEYSDLLTHLIKLAMNRHERKSKISREYIEAL